MRKMLLVLAGLMLIASPCFAQSDTSYVGLFTDDAHTAWTVSGSGFTPFSIYMYWFGSPLGIQAAEFILVAPANVIISSATYKNPDITVELGTLTGGISVAFGNCQAGGVWWKMYQISCFLTTADPSIVEVGPNPSAGAYQVASCELGYPIRPLKRYTNICCNQSCAIATREASWGAIKSLF